MTTLLRLCATLALLDAALAPAQWAPHPNDRVPRTADGAPDLEAPAPRTADGKPDLTGVWQGFGTLGGSAAQAEPESAVPRAGFANVGQNMKEPLPLRPEYAALAEQRRADGGKDNPEATCLPMGIMQFHTQGAPRKFIQTPDVLVILYEASMGIRQIFTDGRAIPTDDPQPWWYGYSVGHWEGDTLVVVTKGLRGGRVARHFRHAVDGRRDVHGAVSPRELRANGDRRDGRRPEGLHGAVDRARQPANHARARAARVRLQREQPLLRPRLICDQPGARDSALEYESVRCAKI